MSFFKKIFSDNEEEEEAMTPEKQWRTFLVTKFQILKVDQTLYYQRRLLGMSQFILNSLKEKNWLPCPSDKEDIFQKYLTDIQEHHIEKLRYNGQLFSEDIDTIYRHRKIIIESIDILNKSKNPQTIKTRLIEAAKNSYLLILFQDNPSFVNIWKIEQKPFEIYNELVEKHDSFIIDVFKNQIKEIESSFDSHTKFTQKKNKLSKIIEKSIEAETLLYDKEELNKLHAWIKAKIDFYYLNDIIEQGNRFVFKNQINKAKDAYLEGLYFIKSYYENETSLDPIKKEIEEKIASITPH